MNRYPYLLLIAMWALISCEETGTPTSYPVTYTRSDVVAGQYRVYTSKGEIEYAYIIRQLMARDTVYFNELADRLDDPNRFDRIRLTSRNEATVTLFGFTSECTVVRTPLMEILKRNDTTSRYCIGQPMTRTYGYLLSSVKPEIFSEYIISSTGGNYVFGYTSRESVILNNLGSTYSIPFVMYASESSGRFYGSSYSGYINNTLQHDFYKQLNANDTVAVMEYAMLLKRQ